MKNKIFFLAIDQGTTSTRSIIFNEKFKVIANERIQNKEFWFLTLSLLCRFFKNPQKEIVNVFLALISNIANTILIYFCCHQ